MRVLLVAHRYLPHHQAGVENYTFELAKNLSARHDVAVAATRKVISRPMGWVQRRDYAGIPVYEAVNHHAFESYRDTYASTAMESAWRRILNEVRPEVVHFQHLMYWSTALPGLAKRAGARTVFTLHDDWHLCSRMGQMLDPWGAICPEPGADRCSACMAQTSWRQPDRARRVIPWLIRIRQWTGLALDGWARGAAAKASKNSEPTRPSETVTDAEASPWRAEFEARRHAFLEMAKDVDAFVSSSPTLLQRHHAFGIPTGSFRHIQQGIDAAPFESARRRPVAARAPTAPLALAFIGQIAPHKGLHILIDAIRAAPTAHLRLIVAGSDRHAPAYGQEQRARAARDSRIEWLGEIPRVELPNLYGRIDLLCVPSLWYECAPLTICEAVAAGRPVLASDLGGMADLLHAGRIGRLLPLGDVGRWSAEIASLAADPQKLVALIDPNFRFPTVDEHVAALEALYR